MGRCSTPRPWARRLACEQRGVVVVEAAIVTPLFFLMIFGILEFGLAFHDKLTTANMSRSGARAATTFADDPLADHQLTRAIDRAANALDRQTIRYVVVYKAADPGARVPAGSCADGLPSETDSCNVYTPGDLRAGPERFGCDDPSDLDRFWCPSTRKVATTVASGGPPDYVGVYVRVRHDNLTGLFGNGWTFTEDTVLRIEARRR